MLCCSCAALRGAYHLTELTGADLLMSIHPTWQGPFVTQDFPREERIEKPVSPEAIDRLRQMPEFVRAYEPDGMSPAEFISYGATNSGWGWLFGDFFLLVISIII
jgi:transaldolase